MRAEQEVADLRARVEAELAMSESGARGAADHLWQARIAGVCRVARAGLVGGGVDVQGASAKYRGLRRRGGVPGGWERHEECGALAFARILRHPNFFVNFRYSTCCWGGNDLLVCITRAAAAAGSGLPESLKQISVIDGPRNGVLEVTTIRGGITSQNGALGDLDPTAHPMLLKGPNHYNGTARARGAKAQAGGVPMHVPVALRKDVVEWLRKFGLHPTFSTGNGHCWFESLWWAMAALADPVMAEELLLPPGGVGDEAACGGGALF